MRASDIVAALEAGLITENEATEQGMVETIDALYEKASAGSRWRSFGLRAAAGGSIRR